MKRKLLLFISGLVFPGHSGFSQFTKLKTKKMIVYSYQSSSRLKLNIISVNATSANTRILGRKQILN